MRKAYRPTALMLTSATMASMRETAYGSGTRKEVRDTLFKAETLRDDEALLTAAEQKRLRKQQKRQTLAERIAEGQNHA